MKRTLTALSCFVACAQISMATDFSAWSHQVQLTFTGYTRSQTLTNFPVLVQLSTNISGFAYSQFASASGYDLRFSLTNGTTELPYEAELWNSGGTSYVWVQVPALSGTNTALKIYWGNSSATTQPASCTNGSTWNTNYKAVWHLNAASCVDSTANAWTPTSTAGYNIVSGLAGKCVDFDTITGDNQNQATDRHIVYANDDAFKPTRITIEAWIKASSGETQRRAWFFAHCYSDENWGWALSRDWDDKHGRLLMDVGRGDHGDDWGLQNNSSLEDGNWHYLVGTYDGATERFYIDGTQVGSASWTASLNTDRSSSPRMGSSGDRSDWWKYRAYAGLLDECRISDFDRGSNWVWASYINLASNAVFAAYGDVQVQNAAPSISGNAATSIGATSATLNGTLTSTGGAPTFVWVYWGPTDQGTTKSGWTHAAALGYQVAGTVSGSVTSLLPSTTYYCRFYASNSVGDAWAESSTNFLTPTGPSITNTLATQIGTTSATLNCSLFSTGDAPTLVWVYWDTADRATSKSAWGASSSLGYRAAGNLSQDVAGLSSNTTYYFRYYASNQWGDAWGEPSASLITLGSPVIADQAATNVQSSSAFFNGDMSYDGGAAATVYLYWGTTDGGASKAAWANAACLGVRSEGNISTNIQGLTRETTYYYRYYASNSMATAWAGSSTSFQTLLDFSAWQEGRRLTFSGYRKAETLSNFPVLVTLNTSIPGFSYSQFASPSGFDLRFSDASGATELSYEIEQWNTNGDSYVWVALPSLSSNGTIRAYWDNTNAMTRQVYTTNGAVWAGVYDCVIHGQDIFWRYNDSPHWKNSVRTDPNQQPVGLLEEIGSGRCSNNVPTIIGQGLAFDGADDHAYCQDLTEITSYPNNFWIEFWACPSNGMSIDTSVVGSGGGNAGERLAWGRRSFPGDTKADVAVSVGTNGLSVWDYSGNGPYDKCQFMIPHHITNWVHVVVVYSNKTPRLYVDGVYCGQGTQCSRDIFSSLAVGVWGSTDNPYGGRLDEMRFGKTADCSSNRAWAAWLNMASNNTFISFGMPEPPEAFVMVPASDGGGYLSTFYIAKSETIVSDFVACLNAFTNGELAVTGGQVRLAATSDLLCLTVAADSRASISYDAGAQQGLRFEALPGKENDPMVFVTWFGAAWYCNWRSSADGLTAVYAPASGWTANLAAGGYRLPTEPEWYKAAAWNPLTSSFMLYGTGTDTISGSQANYLNSGDAWEGNAVRTCPVGTFGYGENSYFLRDASGNAWEWCHGLYGSGTNVAADPHVLRGGGWGNLDVDIQAGARSGLTPGEARDSVGFRVLTTTDVR